MGLLRRRLKILNKVILVEPLRLIYFLFKLLFLICGGVLVNELSVFKKNVNKSDQKFRILHIVPRSLLTQHKLHGSNKDILNFESVLSQDNKYTIDRLYVDRGRLSILNIFNLRNKKKLGIKSYPLIIINVPGNNGLFSLFLKMICNSTALLAYRAHNADTPHRLDKLKVEGIPLSVRFSILRAAVYSFFSDRIVSRVTDYVLPISRFDTYNYWDHLNANTLHIPYIPKSFQIKSFSERTDILSIGAATGSEFAIDQELNFYRNVENIQLEKNYNFVQVGGNRTNLAPPNVQAHGMVKDLQKYISKARVICCCSKLGRGTKTKVADAVASGIRVIVDEDLFWKLDVELMHGCIPYGQNSDSKNFTEALEVALENVTENEIFTVQNGENIKNNIIEICSTTCQILLGRAFNHHEPINQVDKDVNLLTVLYDPSEKFILNVKNTNNLNDKCKINWHIVINGQKNKKWIDYNRNLEIAAPKVKFIIHYGYQNTLIQENRGSINHAAGLHKGLVELVKVNAQNILIMDPDIFIVQKNLITDIFKHMESSKNKLIGTIPEPGILTHNIDYPSVHFMAVKFSNEKILKMDFSPDLLLPKKIKIVAKKYMATPAPGKITFRLPGQIRHMIYYYKVMGINGDTGYRIAKFRKEKIQIFQYLKSPRGAKTLRTFKRFNRILMRAPFIRTRRIHLEQLPSRPKEYRDFGAIFRFPELYNKKIILLHQHSTQNEDDSQIIKFIKKEMDRKNTEKFDFS